MTMIRACSFAWTVLLIAAWPALAQWTPVGPGVDYRHYAIAGPNQVFVTRMDRANTECIIESSLSLGTVRGGRETVSGMVNRYQDGMNYWGQTWGARNQVIAAINGSYFNTTTGVPFSGVIHSGSYDKRYDNVTSDSGFAWTLNRVAFIGECVSHVNSKQVITYANNNTQNFQGINRERGNNELIIFTPRYDVHTYTDNTGSEVLVELDRPLLLMPTPAGVNGIVRQIRPNLGSTPIPFDHLVLSAKGNAANTLLGNVSVGATIKISQEIQSFSRDCSTPRALDWTKAYAGVSGNWVFLKEGVVQTNIDSSGAVHPRTAIAINDNYVFFVVVDGRQAGYSVGMTINALAAFCKDTLGATWGVNQDGGGSSAMWVNGTIVNKPSDGSERTVANGMMMVAVQPKQVSTRFTAGEPVKTTAATVPRLGPGINFGAMASVPAETTGAVIGHALQGVRGSGKMWWKCQIGGTTGWFDQAALESIAPRIPDFDEDGDVDQEDFGYFQSCLTGSAVPQTDPACSKALLDGDEDVDHNDFAIFEACFSGPGIPYHPDCAN